MDKSTFLRTYTKKIIKSSRVRKKCSTREIKKSFAIFSRFRLSQHLRFFYSFFFFWYVTEGGEGWKDSLISSGFYVDTVATRFRVLPRLFTCIFFFLNEDDSYIINPWKFRYPRGTTRPPATRNDLDHTKTQTLHSPSPLSIAEI